MTVPMTAILRRAIAAAAWHEHPAEDPGDVEAYLELLRVLYRTGRHDLPLGRLLEGHVDAVQIVNRYGSAEQVAQLRHALAAGAILGVWNAGLADEPLTLDGTILRGGKSFASGAGVLTHSLVTADTSAGPQLVLVDLERTPPEIDRNWWHVVGMQRSETHRVRWASRAIEVADLIGDPGDYAREPHFSGGALRFVAVHAGGVAALLDHTCNHLTGTGRSDDAQQAARVSELFLLADGAAGAVVRAAHEWFATNSEEARLSRVGAARLSVLDAAQRAMTIAQEAVGLQGMFAAHPLSATLTDLSVYLRQPGPDAQRLRVSRAVASGDLRTGI